VAEPAIVFIGFMGAGKTTALQAAREAGLETTEVDQLMEREMGMPIRQAFEERGEAAFREDEAAVVGELLEDADGGAIALGGGSVLSERVRAALGRHLVVWLQVGAEEAWRRIDGTGRPLARSREDVDRLLAKRQPLYGELADAVVMPGDRGVTARALPAILALRGLPSGTKLLWASTRCCAAPASSGSGGRCRAAASVSPTPAWGNATRSGSRRSRPGSRSSPARRRRRSRRRSGSCAS
jgi:shikimate kinase/3-dehydroquinate synthase